MRGRSPPARRTVEYRRRESNPHRPCGPRRSERRAYAFRHGGMMAPAGIEPATRWISPSRSTGELQEPRTKPTGVEPAPSRETVGRAGRYATASSATACRWYDPAKRMTSPPGSRVTTREPAIRRQPYQTQHCCITCIHRLSKSILHGAKCRTPHPRYRRWGVAAALGNNGRD